GVGRRPQPLGPQLPASAGPGRAAASTQGPLKSATPLHSLRAVAKGFRSVEDAIALAAEAHRGQRCFTPEGKPFVFHPLRVLLAFLDDPVEQMAAVLHDVVEDTDVELQDLASAGYPPEVVAAVDALTHREGVSYEDYIERVAANEVAGRVKVQDVRPDLANNRR